MKLPKLSFRKKLEPGLGSENTDEKISGPAVSEDKDSGGAKQWMVLHLEKICFAAAGITFGLLIYTAAGRLSVNPKHNAAELANKASQMEALIDRSDWDGSADQIPDFAAQVQRANRPIESGNYSFKSLVGFETQKVRKRTWPKFLPAEDVWAEGGSGIFWIAGRPEKVDDALKMGVPPARDLNSVSLSLGDYEGAPAPRAATAEIKHWAAITALIPVKKQKALYARTYQEAEEYQPLEDVPNYLLARIQRIELKSGYLGAKDLNWDEPDMQWEWTPQLAKEKMNVNETALGRLNPSKHDRWATEAGELVDARYVHPRLTTPLGPLGYVGWEQWATHPSIPLSDLKRKNGDGKSRQKMPSQTADRFQKKQFEDKAAVNKNNGDNRARKFEEFFNPTPDKSSQPVSVENKDVPDKSKSSIESVADENQLLRLFDFDVKPGKTYVYRVQLLLKNPNHNKPSRILRDPTHRKSPFVPDQKLPWSEQSAPVYIPPLTEVYAAVVSEPTKKEATVIVKAPTGNEGNILIGELTLSQGGVVVDGSLRGERSYEMNGIGRKLTQGEDDGLDAELLLVDIRSQVPVPGEAGMSDLLFLDPNGEFLLRNTASVRDQRETQRFKKLSNAYDRGTQKLRKDADANRRRSNDGRDDDLEDKALLGGKDRKDK